MKPPSSALEVQTGLELIFPLKLFFSSAPVLCLHASLSLFTAIKVLWYTAFCCCWVTCAVPWNCYISTCKLANLTVKTELGCCLLHRSGRVTIDECVLQCETNPLDHLSCPIVTTAGDEEDEEEEEDILSHVEVKETVVEKIKGNSVIVLQTMIEGGAKAVSTSGDLVLQRVRVMYSKAYLYFWFDVDSE